MDVQVRPAAVKTLPLAHDTTLWYHRSLTERVLGVCDLINPHDNVKIIRHLSWDGYYHVTGLDTIITMSLNS